MIRSSIVVGSLLVLLLAAPVGAATQYSLTVTVTDGVDEARSGDTLDYVATIVNSGGEPFEGVVTISSNAFVTLDGTTSWPVTLAPGESKEFEVTATVGDITGDDYQVVTLASVAAADAASEVLVRAADADRVPGAEVPADVPGLVEPDDTSLLLPWLIGIAAGALVLCVVAVLVWWRRVRHP